MAEERWIELPLPEGIQGAVCQEEGGVAVFASSSLGTQRRAIHAQLHQKAQSLPAGPGGDEEEELMRLWQEAQATQAALQALLEDEEAALWQRHSLPSMETGVNEDETTATKNL